MASRAVLAARSLDIAMKAQTAFEWDEQKRAQNLGKHKLDFIICVELFDGRGMVTSTSSKNGEIRFLSVTAWNEIHVTAIWTWRGDVRRIISLRRARDVEKRMYEDIFG